MIGQITKIHSDFYYIGNLECKVREALKKQGIKIYVGDYVKIELINTNQGIITDILPRKNELLRPCVCNVDKAVIVSSVKEPRVDFKQLDRYLALCKFHKIETILVFNKCDLGIEKEFVKNTKKVYGALCEKIFFTSAKENIKIKELLNFLKGQTCVLCGASGVGKTSIIKAFVPDLELKIGKVSSKNSRGTHTTRHCEIIEAHESKFVDSPGFSNLKFDFLLPEEVVKLFTEFENIKGCKFKNCLHIDEEGCTLKENSTIESSRYLSYVEFVCEAQNFREKIKNEGNKKENKYKNTQGKKNKKISIKIREKSRRKLKQEIIFDENI